MDNIFIISFYDFLDRQNDFGSLVFILTIMFYDFLMYLQSNENFHCHLNKRNTTFYNNTTIEVQKSFLFLNA